MDLDCILIGETSLLVSCFDHLRKVGFQPSIVVTEDVVVQRHLSSLKPEVQVFPWSEMVSQVRKGLLPQVPFIFSIVNPHILRSDVLGLCTKLAINYHDGPLPRYGGVHATNWAIMNGETLHGVSWIQVAEDVEVDGGAILIQEKVPVYPDDSAFSLNIRCFNASLSSFRELCQRLKEDTYHLLPQDASKKTYYSKYERPPACCVIDFSQTTLQITDFVRSLDFGATVNTIGTPKVVLQIRVNEYQYVAVASAKSTKGGSTDTTPGTVLSVENNGQKIVVATADGRVVLGLVHGEILQSICVTAGQLVQLDKSRASQLTDMSRKAARVEEEWLCRIAAFSPSQFPYHWPNNAGNNPPGHVNYKRIEYDLSSAVDQLNQTLRVNNIAHLALAVCAAFLCRLAFDGQCGLGLWNTYSSTADLNKLCKGFFLSVLPLQVKVHKSESVRDCLRKLTGTIRKYVNPGLVLKDVYNRYFLSAPCSYPVILALEDVADKIDVTAMTREVDFDLCIVCQNSNANLSFHFRLGSNLDDCCTETIVSHLDQFATAVVHSMEQPVLAVNMLSASECVELERFLTGKERQLTPYQCLHQCISQQALKTPDAIAIVDGDQLILYNELDTQSDILASKLADQLGSHLQQTEYGAVVGLLLPRCSGLFISEIACMKMGAVFVVLEPDFTDLDIQHKMNDAKAKLIVSLACLSNKFSHLKQLGYPVLCLDKFDYDCQQKPFHLCTDGTRPVYIAYTSGTTGKPKGVVVEHNSVCNVVVHMSQTYGLQVGDRLMQYLRPAFDGSFCDSYPAFCCGATLVLYPEKSKFSFQENLLKFNITCCCALPPTLAELNPDNFPHIWMAITGGQAVPGALVKRWNDAGKKVFNCYGPTETTIVATVGLTDETAHLSNPVANSVLHIVNSAMAKQPRCVYGKLLIGGVPVSRGYLNNKKKTDERFLTDPFGKGRVYDSGDIVVCTTDDRLLYHKRDDDQVKVSGYRVEPSGIKHVIEQIHGVTMAEVVVHRNQRGVERFIAYVMPDTLSEDMIRQEVSQELPEYCVPSHIILLKTMPIDFNGKINRRQLPQLDQFERDQDNVWQGTSLYFRLRQMICDLFAEVLNESAIGPCADIFDFSIHSLDAQRVTNKLSDSLQRLIPFEVLYQHPTPHRLARHLETSVTNYSAGQRQLSLVQSLLVAPVTPAQHALLFLNETMARPSAYNISCLITIKDTSLSGNKSKMLVRVEKAITRLTERHSALRTSFDFNREKPLQVIHDCSAKQVQKKECITAKDAFSLLSSEGAKTFDLAKDQLMRAYIIQTKEQTSQSEFEVQCFLGLVFHHIVVDLESINVIFNEFQVLYNDPNVELPPAPQYSAYSDLVAIEEDSKPFQHQLDYWTRQLSTAESFSVPRDFIRSRSDLLHGCTVVRTERSVSIDQLKSMAASTSTSVFRLLCAIFCVLLAQYTQSESVLFAIPIRKRNDVVSKCVGMFLNTSLINIHINPTSRFVDVVTDVKKLVGEAEANSDVPFHSVVERLKCCQKSAFNLNPVFQVLFTSSEMDISYKSGNDKNVTIEMEEVNNQFAKFDLFFHVRLLEKQVTVSLEYASDFYSKSTACALLDHYADLLQSCTQTDCLHLPVSQLSSRGTVMTRPMSFNQSDPIQFDVLKLFEDKAQTEPEKPAVYCDNRMMSVSYGQLNMLATSLCTSIKRHHRHGRLVGVYATPSLDAVITVLAVLKAGLAYVPLDPCHPHSRLSSIIKCSAHEMSVLVSSGDLDIAEITNSCREYDIHVLLANPDSESPNVSSGPVLVDLDASTLCYVMFTSGSTGNPKGVAVSRLNVDTYILWLSSAIKGGKWMWRTSLSFDMSVSELFGPLVQGSCMYIPKHSHCKDLGYLVDFVVQHSIEVVHFVPHMWKYFLLHLKETGQRPSSLKHCYCLGDVLLPQLQNDFFQLFGISNSSPPYLHNLYGPTETTVAVTHHLCQPSEDGVVPIGRPFPGTTLMILDNEMKPVPSGISGELYIGGLQVSQGYFNNSRLTSNAFIEKHPFVADCSTPIYKTGDLVRETRSGDVQFIQRIARIAKVRGYRVELDDVGEMVLKLLKDCVQDAYLTVEDQGDYKERLICYLESENGLTQCEEYMKDVLSGHLPCYSVPDEFRVVGKFPRNPGGKLSVQDLTKGQYELVVCSGSDPSLKSELGSFPADVKELVFEQLSRVTGHSRQVIFEQSLSALHIASLSWMRFAALMQQQGYNVAVRDVIKVKSVNELLDVVCLSSNCNAEQMVDGTTSALSDVNLADDIDFVDRMSHHPHPPLNGNSRVLLTGATGFLGPYLLRTLLDKTEAKVTVLLRKQTELDLMFRLEESQRIIQNGLTNNDVKRLEVLEADVSLPQLGLSSSDYERLTAEVDLIVHSAAAVNMVDSYDGLRKVNVLGTLEMLRLAAASPRAVFHFVSTAAVASLVCNERTLKTRDGFKPTGYAMTKWVAETLVMRAANGGLAVTVSRPCLIGPPVSGDHVNIQSLECMLIQSLITTKCYPRRDAVHNIQLGLLPLEHAAAEIVSIASRTVCSDIQHSVYNLKPVSFLSLSGLIDAMILFGYEMVEVDLETFQNRLLSSSAEVAASLASIIHVVFNHLRKRDDQPKMLQQTETVVTIDVTYESYLQHYLSLLAA